MKKIILLALVLVLAVFVVPTYAAPQPKPPSEVAVVNTPNVNVIGDPNNPLPVDDMNTVLPGQVVSLQGHVTSCENVTAARKFIEIFPDGTQTNTPFSIPPGQVLVVTAAHFFSPNLQFTTVSAVLYRESADNSSAHSVFDGVMHKLDNNVGDLHVTFPNGFVVKSGTDLCWLADDVTRVRVYGYLAPDI